MKSDERDETIIRSFFNKRQFLIGSGSAAIGLGISPGLFAQPNSSFYDLIIAGAGTAGLPAAIFASQRGAKVLILEASGRSGGTLLMAMGQMSAAGTKVQKRKGINDTPKEHFDDIIRISKNTVNRDLVQRAVWNAADTFDWLMDHGFDIHPEHPVAGRAHEPYSKLRYYWGKDWGVSIVNVLTQEIKPQIEKGNVTIRYFTHARELIQETDGSVTGIVAQGENGEVERVFGRNVLLACGGYTANPELFEELNGYKQYTSVAYPYSQGAGHKMGVAAGGYLRGAENYLPSFGGVMADGEAPSALHVRANTYPERRQPWEIYVNVNGKRFVKEDVSSVDAREHALLDQPDLRYWIVFDEEIRKKSPPLIGDWTKEETLEAFDGHPMFFKAGTLEELAKKTGVNAENLVRTVARYNYGVATGVDLLGREHKPSPIEKGPFYAIQIQGYSVTSTVGLAVDKELRVIRRSGDVIPNLYAAGELLGSSQTMGRAACGGMMITPALTFGRLLGQKMLPLD